MDYARLFAQSKYLRLVSVKLVDEILAGKYRSVFRGPGLEFNYTREYVENDDVRQIDWNVTSRLGTVHTKVFQEERAIKLILIVDVSASMMNPAKEPSRRYIQENLFTLLTLAAIQNNDRVGAIFFTDKVEKWVPPKKGRRYGLRLMQQMLTLKPSGRGSNLSVALRVVNETCKQRSIAVILSDFKTCGYERELIHLARRHDVVAIRIVDELDVRFPPSGLIPIVDSETNETMLTMGRSRNFRIRYKKYWEQQRYEWKSMCERLKISALEVHTHNEPAAALLHFFRHRWRRQRNR